MSMGPRIAAEQAMTCSCSCWSRGCWLLAARARANELCSRYRATSVPVRTVDEPLQVEAAGGGMIGKSKGTRTTARPVWERRCRWTYTHTHTHVCTHRRRRCQTTGDLRGWWNAAGSRTATRARRWLLDKICIGFTRIEVCGIAGRASRRA